METKVFRRNVSVIEVRKDSDFLGYYTGRDRNGVVHYDERLSKAMVIKTNKGCEHFLFNLNKFQGNEFSFTKVDCLESFITTYYDEYDEVNPKKVDLNYIIRLKKKADLLSEPSYLSKFDKKEKTFESSLNIEKAIMVGESHSERLLYHLTRKYGDKYEFYKEKLFIKKDREIIIIDGNHIDSF